MFNRHWHQFIKTAGFFCLFSALTASAADFGIERHPLKGCDKGTGTILTFDFHDPGFAAKYDLIVVNQGPKLIQQVVQGLRDQGLFPVAVVNGGYFDTLNYRVLSYYKSDFLGLQHIANSAKSPRACTVFGRREKGAPYMAVAQSTPTNHRGFQRAHDAEIFCAGPQLVEKGADVSQKHYCSERFNPHCREDGQDPGINYGGNLPRTASCVTRRGELKLFAFSSPVQRCGVNLSNLSEIMVKEGCREGMNHDGGSSTKMFVDPGRGDFFYVLGAPGERGKRVPVWVAIVEKRR